MVYWNKRLLLALFISTLTQLSFSQDDEQAIIPSIERRTITVDAIDSENVEIGIHAGIISLEDFESVPVAVLRAAWHVSENFFFEASFSKASGDQTSYEELTGGFPLFSDEQRDFNQYNLALGWNILPGRVFISDQFSFNSSFYLIGGIGTSDFLGDNWFTATVGAGYKILLTDAWVVHIDVRDHLFDRDTFGSDETTNNIEMTMGISLYF